MPARRADISNELRAPFLVLLILLPILALAGYSVYSAVRAASDYQGVIRHIELTRALVLVDQLDEETGIRGFAATGDAGFLAPYEAARATMPARLAALEKELTDQHLSGGARLAADEARLNQHWILTVADPLHRLPFRSPAALITQRNGKTTVDGFRQDDRKLQVLLESAADSADVRTSRALSRLLLFVVGALCLLTAGASAFGFFQARAARRAFENRVLYENQKRIADELQTAFLNKQLPVSRALRFHAIYMPATTEAQLGGDWYDAFELPDKRILFSIGDVAGHGLEAALVMSRARQAIIAAALHENDPAAVLERANAAILLQSSPMVTAICGFIDPATFEVTYATAGHPPPVLAKPGAPAEVLPHDGLPLGIHAEADYRPFVATAAEGALLVLYTDGVTEFRRDAIDGEARLLAAARIARQADDPASSIARSIFGGSPPADDVAILTVTFAARAGRPQVATAGMARAHPERTAVDGGDAAPHAAIVVPLAALS